MRSTGWMGRVCAGLWFTSLFGSVAMTYSRRDARPSPYAACSTNGEPRNVINQTSQSLPPFALLATALCSGQRAVG